MMKSIKLSLCLLITFQVLFAQQAEVIPSYATKSQSLAWYKQQQKAWQKETQTATNSETAWYNYFKVSRILVMHDTTDQRKDEERDQDLVRITDQMEKYIPNSYSYHFCMWQHGGNDMKYYPHLEKAIKIDPNRTEHIDYMINVGEMKRDIGQRDKYCHRKFEVGQFSPGFLYYNYNTLIGLEPNAILLTGGDNDTYPAWALQARGIRKDVVVINQYLVHIDEYREKLFKELGLAPLVLDESNRQGFDKILVQHLLKNSQKRSVYIALTTMGCDDYTALIKANLYLTGLAYRYSDEAFDNMASMKKNFEKLFALDYIDKPFYAEPSEGRIRDVNRNYIIPMLKLYDHYKNSGETSKEIEIKEKLLFISKDTEDEEMVLNYLK